MGYAEHENMVMRADQLEQEEWPRWNMASYISGLLTTKDKNRIVLTKKADYKGFVSFIQEKNIQRWCRNQLIFTTALWEYQTLPARQRVQDSVVPPEGNL